MRDADLYISLSGHSGLLARVVAQHKEILHWYQLEEYLDHWGTLIGGDKTIDGIDFWEGQRVEWSQNLSTIKLLAVLALAAFILGLFRKSIRLKDSWRLIIALLILVVSYTYCLAQWIKSEEQMGYLRLGTLQKQLNSEPAASDWQDLLKARALASETFKDDVLIQPWLPRRWWHVEWFDSFLYRRVLAEFSTLWATEKGQPEPLISPGDLDDFRASVAPANTQPAISPSQTPPSGK
jgi:hypothetical protein